MKKGIVISIAVLVLLAVAAYFIFGHSSTGKVTVSSDGTNKVITIEASRFQYTPGTITVKQGDHVKIIIINTDATHGISIPGYSVSGLDSVEFVADKVGTFDFHCPTFCGPGHKEMTGTLVVEA